MEKNKIDIDLKTVSNAALAYLGDSVIEVCVREHLVSLGFSTSAHLNKASRDFVRASAQAEAMKKILPILSEEETAVFKRGRNIGHTNTPKSASVGEYRMATGMEALFGWLHLLGESERIRELFCAAYDIEKIFENKERNTKWQIPK